MAKTTPRDMVIDQKELGYIRRADGSLIPHSQLTQFNVGKITPRAKPDGAVQTAVGRIFSRCLIIQDVNDGQAMSAQEQ